MKKQIVCILVFCLCATVLAGCRQESGEEAGGNATDEMKIAYTCDLSPEDGADSVERAGDHTGSPYVISLDCYNLQSSDTLTILTHVQTQQQTSEWSCGVSSALMVLNWYGRLGEHDEESLAAYRSNGLTAEATGRGGGRRREGTGLRAGERHRVLGLVGRGGGRA